MIIYQKCCFKSCYYVYYDETAFKNLLYSTKNIRSSIYAKKLVISFEIRIFSKFLEN